MRRRKVSRKFIRGDKERLEERRKFLSSRGGQQSQRRIANDITEEEEVEKEEEAKDDIEMHPKDVTVGYENPIERLRSLGKIN